MVLPLALPPAKLPREVVGQQGSWTSCSTTATTRGRGHDLHLESCDAGACTCRVARPEVLAPLLLRAAPSGATLLCATGPCGRRRRKDLRRKVAPSSSGGSLLPVTWVVLRARARHFGAPRSAKKGEGFDFNASLGSGLTCAGSLRRLRPEKDDLSSARLTRHPRLCVAC